ncbi:O-antigen ligase family protein [bacterium]|nr:O-antigen ligase family protein [bacterium]
MKKVSPFIILALVFIPFDGVPVLFPTTYRPLSLLFLIPSLLLIVLSIGWTLRLRKSVAKLTLAFVYFSLSSIILTTYFGYAWDGFLDFFVTFSLGISAFTVFLTAFTRIRSRCESNDELIALVFKYISIGYVIMILVGCVEFLSLYTPAVSVDVKKTLNLLTSGKISSRLQLTSGEPSWAARQALFGLPILLIAKGRNSFWTISLFVLFLLTFSLEGFFVMALSTLVYFAYLYWEKKRTFFRKMLKVTLGLVFLSTVVFFFAKEVFLKGNGYYSTRFDKLASLQSVQLANLIYLDESVFLRTAYPAAAFLMFVDYPVLGVGGGNYRYHFGKYINENFPSASKFGFTQMKRQHIGKKEQTKNVYARMLGEFGLVGITMFLFFLAGLTKRLRNAQILNEKTKRYLFLWFIMCVLSLIQFDSFAYINFWLLSAFILSLRNARHPDITGEKTNMALVSKPTKRHC